MIRLRSLFTRRERGPKQVFLAVIAIGAILVVMLEQKLSAMSRYRRRVYFSPAIQDSEYTRKFGGKWIVTSSVGSVNVTNIRGWTILVHGNDNSKCRPPVCIHLDDELALYSEIPVSQPRELTAYLVAISYRPTCLLAVTEWQDGMSPLLSKFLYKEFASGILAKTDKTIIDLQTIFTPGTGNLSDNATLSVSPYYNSYDFSLVGNLHPLLQNVVFTNHTKYGSQHAIHPPPVFLPVDTFTSLDFVMTLFRPDAFWALILKHVTMGDLIAQRLLWEMEGLVMLLPGSVTQTVKQVLRFRPNTYPPHIEVVKKFNCEEDLNIIDCLDFLTQLLREKGLVSSQVEETVKSWISNLHSVGYQPPRRSGRRILDVQATGVFSPYPKGKQKQNGVLSLFRKTCPKTNFHQAKHFISDIALIITFNKAKLYDNIPLLEVMYRPHFEHIIYCGPDLKEFRQYSRNTTLGYYVFLEGYRTVGNSWHYMFECTVLAMKINLGVRGFLQIGDDTLLNSWNLEDLPRDRIWLHTGMRSANSSLKQLHPLWYWWANGKAHFQKLLKEISDEKNYHKQNEVEIRFLEIYRNSSKNFTKLYIQGCDFMYMPVKLKDDYIKLAGLLVKHKVMLELGFPNIALGMQNWEDIHFVEDGSLWHNKHQVLEKYRRDKIYVHPFKLKEQLLNEKGRTFFCDVYMGGPEESVLQSGRNVTTS